jgi:integrase
VPPRRQLANGTAAGSGSTTSAPNHPPLRRVSWSDSRPAFAGTDPVWKKDLYLTEVVPPGTKGRAGRTRLLNQVNDKRNPKTRATVDQLIAKYFPVLDVDTLTMRGYKSKYENHIRPLIGSVQLSRLDIETLDSFYSELRTCRDHCRGRRCSQHRTDRPHQCDEHEGDRCPRNKPEGCRRCRRVCTAHECKGLSASTIRQVHLILSGALDRAVGAPSSMTWPPG